MKHIHYFANGVTVTSEVSSQFGEEVHITEALRRLEACDMHTNSSVPLKCYEGYIRSMKGAYDSEHKCTQEALRGALVHS